MDNQLELLNHLRKIQADVKEKEITDKLEQMGLVTSSDVYDFLHDLEKEKYISWTDARPRKPWSSESLFGFSPDPASPPDYRAKITIEGLKFLRDDDFKIYNKATAIGAAITAVIAILVSIYFGVSSGEKDEQIKSLKQELLVQENKIKAKNDSINIIKDDLKLVRQDLIAERERAKLKAKKDSATTANGVKIKQVTLRRR